MYTIIETNTYKTDYKKLKKTGANNGILEDIKRVTKMLKDGTSLPEKYRDHKLQGTKKNEEIRDCHIRPDIVLIYKRDSKQLILYMLRLSSHSNLFSSLQNIDKKMNTMKLIQESTNNKKYTLYVQYEDDDEMEYNEEESMPWLEDLVEYAETFIVPNIEGGDVKFCFIEDSQGNILWDSSEGYYNKNNLKESVSNKEQKKDKKRRILVNSQDYDNLFSKYCSHPRAMTFTEYKN